MYLSTLDTNHLQGLCYITEWTSARSGPTFRLFVYFVFKVTNAENPVVVKGNRDINALTTDQNVLSYKYQFQSRTTKTIPPGCPAAYNGNLPITVGKLILYEAGLHTEHREVLLELAPQGLQVSQMTSVREFRI